MEDYKIGILTISDRSSAGTRPDAAGPALKKILAKNGWSVSLEEVIPDEIPVIRDRLIAWSDREQANLIFTTGGTGFSPRDVTPEATMDVLDRAAPGIAEAMRSASSKITPHAMLSRAVAGMRGKTLIINLPGSPKGAVENIEVVLPVLLHAVQLVSGDSQAEAGHQVS